MKNRFLIMVIVVCIGVGLFSLMRFVKRDAVASTKTDPQNSSTTVNIESYLKEAREFRERGSLLEAK